MHTIAMPTKRWAIFCLIKTCKYECIGRYSNRQDAEVQLAFLRKYVPQAEFVLAQDIKQDSL